MLDINQDLTVAKVEEAMKDVKKSMEAWIKKSLIFGTTCKSPQQTTAGP
jgi:hypothetical protein